MAMGNVSVVTIMSLLVSLMVSTEGLHLQLGKEKQVKQNKKGGAVKWDKFKVVDVAAKLLVLNETILKVTELTDAVNETSFDLWEEFLSATSSFGQIVDSFQEATEMETQGIQAGPAHSNTSLLALTNETISSVQDLLLTVVESQSWAIALLVPQLEDLSNQVVTQFQDAAIMVEEISDESRQNLLNVLRNPWDTSDDASQAGARSASEALQDDMEEQQESKKRKKRKKNKKFRKDTDYEDEDDEDEDDYEPDETDLEEAMNDEYDALEVELEDDDYEAEDLDAEEDKKAFKKAGKHGGKKSKEKATTVTKTKGGKGQTMVEKAEELAEKQAGTRKIDDTGLTVISYTDAEPTVEQKTAEEKKKAKQLHENQGCPAGFIFSPRDMDGATKTSHTDTLNMNECGDICKSREGCSSFEYYQTKHTCQTFTEGNKDHKQMRTKADDAMWKSCVKDRSNGMKGRANQEKLVAKANMVKSKKSQKSKKSEKHHYKGNNKKKKHASMLALQEHAHNANGAAVKSTSTERSLSMKSRPGSTPCSLANKKILQANTTLVYFFDAVQGLNSTLATSIDRVLTSTLANLQLVNISVRDALTLVDIPEGLAEPVNVGLDSILSVGHSLKRSAKGQKQDIEAAVMSATERLGATTSLAANLLTVVQQACVSGSCGKQCV